jgi:hypothetical protein
MQAGIGVIIQTDKVGGPGMVTSNRRNMTDRVCPNCKGKLNPIKLIGTGLENPLSGLADQTELQFFTGGDAERGAFSGAFTPAGRIESFLCSDCGQIVLYGVSKGA